MTPPTKTIANMASPNQQQQSFSNLLNQAHETLYTSTPMNTCQRLPLAGPYQQNPKNNMNQTFDCINPDLNPQEPPNLNSNTSPVSVPVSAPVLHLPGYQPLPSQSAHLPTLPTYPYPHDNVRSNISMEMFVSTINIINQRLERIDVVVCEKLSKLDNKNYERFDEIEKSITNSYQEIENVKTTQKCTH